MVDREQQPLDSRASEHILAFLGGVSPSVFPALTGGDERGSSATAKPRRSSTS